MILLVRHGETEWNVARRFQGRRDSPLTALGQRQVRAMGRLVRDLIGHDGRDGWRLISSPLPRTVTTAQAVSAATGLSIEFDARLAEVHCGEWEGQLFSDIVARNGGIAARELVFSGPGGETYEAVAERLESFLCDLPPEPQRRVVLVSHGAASRVLRALYADLPREAAIHLDSPQDAVWRLVMGQVDRFDCEPIPL